jgi:hypothetical protein
METTAETRPKLPKIKKLQILKAALDSVKQHLNDDDLLFSIFETIPENNFSL